MRLRTSLLAAGALLLGACYGNDKDPAAPRPSFVVTPNQTSITVRVDAVAPTPLAATVKTTAGADVADAEVSYVPDDATIAGIAFVGGNYYVYGRQPGTTRIQVKYGVGSAPAFIDVTVTPHPVTQVDLLPATATILSGNTVQLTATLLASPTDTIKPTKVGTTTVFSRAATFSVASADAAVASVSSTGRVTGLKGGTARVIATYKNTSKAATPAAADTATVADTSVITVTQSPVATITVTPTTAQISPKGSVTLRYTYRGANNSTTTAGAPTVVSSDTTIATVGAVDAAAQTVIVTGVKVGDATITFSFTPAGASSPVTQTALIAVR